MKIQVFRDGDILTFTQTLFPAGVLTAPEGTIVTVNALIPKQSLSLPGGRKLTADGAVYAAGRGWDDLTYEGEVES